MSQCAVICSSKFHWENNHFFMHTYVENEKNTTFSIIKLFKKLLMFFREYFLTTDAFAISKHL